MTHSDAATTSHPATPTRYIIAGGGCYGSDYVRQLLRADDRGAIAAREIIVLDRLASCDVAEAWSDERKVRVVRAEWCDWIDEWWPRRSEFIDDRWVPPPIAPHILFEWALKLAQRAHPGWRHQPWQTTPPSGFEFSEPLRSGSLALSHAPGMCPVHCIEPEKCPLTSSSRTWEMEDSVRKMLPSALEDDSSGGYPVISFRCQHHAYGVGTIAFEDIIRELNRLLDLIASDAQTIAVATVSSCHGLVDLLTRSVD